MNQEQLNSMRRIAGLAPSYDGVERKRLEEREAKSAGETTVITEAANNRAPSKVIADIAKQHLHVRSLAKTGDDDKDYHDCPCWAIEQALKAAFKAGQSAGPKAVKESAGDSESTKEAKDAGQVPPFKAKGGTENPKTGKDKVSKEATDEEKKQSAPKKGKSGEDYNTPDNKDADAVSEGKKADKDYDKDGKVETSAAEHKGSVDKAIKKSKMQKDAEHRAGEETDQKSVKENRENDDYRSSYKKGDNVTCRGVTCIVHIPDAKADYIGVIPVGMRSAPEKEKDANVDLVKTSEVNPASDEDCEMAYGEEEMAVYGGLGGRAGTMEGSSEGYQNPPGTKLKADPKSGANAPKGKAYKETPHKDNSEGAESKDKGAKGLKKIGEGESGADAKKGDAYKDKPHKSNSEDYTHKKSRKMGTKGLKKIKEANAEDATVWGKDYGHDDRMVDRNESPDQIATQDPNELIKVNVPKEYKKALREEIDKLRKEADRVAGRDYWGADFYSNTADAFENLLEHLETGTRRSLLWAQIDLNRVMSPMIQRLPNDVYMYIVRGGKPAALTELFKEVKVKREKGADLSKETYTK